MNLKSARVKVRSNNIPCTSNIYEMFKHYLGDIIDKYYIVYFTVTDNKLYMVTFSGHVKIYNRLEIFEDHVLITLPDEEDFFERIFKKTLDYENK